MRFNASTTLQNIFKMAGTSNKPFVLLNEEEMCELIDDSDAENTKKLIRYGISRMNSALHALVKHVWRI